MSSSRYDWRMIMRRCKFCGKELKRGYEDYYEYYYCECDGLKKYNTLMNELKALNQKVSEKQKEIRDFELSGAYGKVKRKEHSIQKELEEFESGYVAYEK